MSAEWAENNASGAAPGNPGALLAAQRESLGMSVNYIAEQMKLQPRQIIALEAGDMDALPGLAVVRGFVRAYAKVVKLDPAPLVAMLAGDTGPTEAGPATRPQALGSYSDPKRPVTPQRDGMPIGAVVAAVVAVGGLIAAYQFDLLPSNKHAEPAASASLPAPLTASVAEAPKAAASESASATDVASTPAASAPAAASAEAAPAPTPAPPAPNGIGLKPTQASLAAAQAPAAAIKPPATAAATPTPAPVQATPAPAPAPAAAAPAPAPKPAAAAAAGNQLVIKVKQDSWVQINLHSEGTPPPIKRMVKAGNTETFDINEEANLVIGNPDGVEVTFRGAPVALPLQEGKTFSRVKLK